MDIEIPDKTYFRIGEVSKILGVEPYVVRYWETEFKTVKPIRTKSEQRLYRRKDLEAAGPHPKPPLPGPLHHRRREKKDSGTSPGSAGG